MTEKQIIELYESEKPIFLAWGDFIKTSIESSISELGHSCGSMIKIPVVPRVKENKSLIDKALYRGKAYSDPYSEITDKVGCRFVVLTLDEINIINSIVEGCDLWEISKDKDFEKEREEKPEFFTYQSVHYIIRSNSDLMHGVIPIPKGTPCELQIRTLLQHSYAELSHDVAYKKETHVSPEMRRIFARSMALIETTDLLFREVHTMVDDDKRVFNEFIEIFSKTDDYKDYVYKINRLIFDSYKPFIDNNSISFMDVRKFIADNAYLYDSVKNSDQILYGQPILYLVYYLINHFKNQTYHCWPLTDSELRPLYNILGISLNP